MTRLAKLKIGLGAAVLFLVGNAGWQVASCEIANAELQDDMKDIASQMGVRTGYTDVRTDEQLRDTVLGKAENYNIALTAEQITVTRTGYGKDATIYLGADYEVPIHLPAGYSYVMHFSPSSTRD